VPGYPIRTSSDPCSVDSSPRHIAASHVLHRLSMPRHPPCALKHLQTQKPTIKKSKLHKTNTPPPPGAAHLLRCSQPLSNYQTPHPTTKWSDNNPHNKPSKTAPGVASGPNSVPAALPSSREKNCCCAPGWRHYSVQPLHGFRSGPVPEPFSWCSLERR
jgi:hypothetical protein